MPSITQSRGRRENAKIITIMITKAACLLTRERQCYDVSSPDPAGIIPMNATPGKACGATLGEICNTSEVRGR